MTISNTVRTAGPYTGNNVTTVFPFGFKVFLDSEVMAVRSDGTTQTLLVLNTDYTVSLNADQDSMPGGSITTIGTPLSPSYTLTISSDVEELQGASLQNQGGFYPKVIENALDRSVILIQQLSSIVSRTLRFPLSDAGSNTELPTKANRANKLLSFDANGNPVAVAPADQSASSVAILLANFIALIASVLGASNVGGKQTGTGTVARTLQDEVFDRVHIKQFGAVCDGVADDTAAWQAAINSGRRTIDARGMTSKITGQINLVANQTIDLTGAKITTTGSTGRRFSAAAVNDWSIIGPFDIVGDGATVGTCIGIYVSDCARWRIDSPNISNIRGHGILRDGGTNTTTRSDHGSIINPKIKGSYRGYEDQAGTGAEYVTLVNPIITECTDFGLKTAAGNVLCMGGHVVDNLQDGVVIGAGSNNAHGSFIGTNINHNIRYNIWTQQVLNGESFVGCHIYANNNSGQGAIFLDRSKGISISGGHWDCQVYNYKDGSSGMNMIENMYCPGGYGISRQIGGNDGFDQLVVRDCYGPGSFAIAGGKDGTGVTINDPSPCYIYADRQGASTQALTSGVTATLLWQRELLDRRNAFDPATGIFTTPADKAGMYTVKFDVIFNGTSMNGGASYVAFVTNGATQKYSFAEVFGTTKLAMCRAFDVYLNAGDTVRLDANITGTTPSFGDATVTSTFSVERIA